MRDSGSTKSQSEEILRGAISFVTAAAVTGGTGLRLLPDYTLTQQHNSEKKSPFSSPFKGVLKSPFKK